MKNPIGHWKTWCSASRLTARGTIGGLSATIRLECFDLFDPAFVASTVEAGVEPNFNQSLDQLLANQIRRETQHIDVVMATTDFSRHFVMAGGRTNSRHFIRGNRHPNAGPTDQNTSVGILACDLFRNDRGNIWVINRRLFIGSRIDNLVTESLQQVSKLQLELNSTMVVTDRYPHFLSYSDDDLSSSSCTQTLSWSLI